LAPDKFEEEKKVITYFASKYLQKLADLIGFPNLIKNSNPQYHDERDHKEENKSEVRRLHETN
jgi:hypothetical protein